MPSASFCELRCDQRPTNDVIVIVMDAYSWCGPCKALSPILQKLESDADTKTGSGLPIDLITVNVDEQGELAQKYDVRSTFSHSLDMND